MGKRREGAAVGKWRGTKASGQYLMMMTTLLLLLLLMILTLIKQHVKDVRQPLIRVKSNSNANANTPKPPSPEPKPHMYIPLRQHTLLP